MPIPRTTAERIFGAPRFNKKLTIQKSRMVRFALSNSSGQIPKLSVTQPTLPKRMSQYPHSSIRTIFENLQDRIRTVSQQVQEIGRKPSLYIVAIDHPLNPISVCKNRKKCTPRDPLQWHLNHATLAEPLVPTCGLSLVLCIEGNVMIVALNDCLSRTRQNV